MLCDICHKNEATIHIQEIHGNQKKTLHLCQDCAREKASETMEAMGAMPPDLTEMLMKFAELPQKLKAEAQMPAPPTPAPAPAAPEPVLFCEKCGWDLASFRKTGKLGCPECCHTFEPYLKGMLSSMHRGTVHMGKRPGTAPAPAAKKPARNTKKFMREEISRLETDLEAAVKAERYEDAAALRDRILELKNTIAGHAHGK